MFIAKYLILLVGLGVMVALGVGTVSYYPKKLYQDVIQRSQGNNYYHPRASVTPYLAPHRGESSFLQASEYSEKFWKTLLLGDYQVPLPVHYPAYYLIPLLEHLGEGIPPVIGMHIYKQNNVKILTLKFEAPFVFSRELRAQTLFKIPIFAQMLRKKNVDLLWQDLFMKKVGVKASDYQEMAYNLYLLHMRSKYFPLSHEGTSYYQGSKKGIIALRSDNAMVKKELVMFQYNNLIHPLVLEYVPTDTDALQIRDRLIKEVQYQKMSHDLSRLVYYEYKALPYRHQISHQGMAYLFSCWTLDYNNAGPLKEMIHLLERGKDNFKLLRPLYDYSLSRYRTSFSHLDGVAGRSEEEKLQKKIDQEKIAREEEEIKRPLDLDDRRFSSDQEKVDHFLRKAKEKGRSQASEDDMSLENTDNNSLIMD